MSRSIPHLQRILLKVWCIRRHIPSITCRNIRRKFTRHRRNRHRSGVSLYGGDPPLRVSWWCVAIARRYCHPRRSFRSTILRCCRCIREAGDGVLGRPPRGLPNTTAGARLCRIVYPDVDEHHNAGRDVERAEGRV